MKKTTIKKIKNKPESNIISEKAKININKLFNIKKTAQYELMNLAEKDCEEIIDTLVAIENEFKQTEKYRNNIRKLRPEYIAITSKEDIFI